VTRKIPYLLASLQPSGIALHIGVAARHVVNELEVNRYFVDDKHRDIRENAMRSVLNFETKGRSE
jgi:hypothetical protein